ncbi:MAG: DUF2905 domain-containing protein [Chitinispirillales bacterium]|nr:DUF2905 domain-containing protein [Chitinispirillales bacterium]
MNWIETGRFFIMAGAAIIVIGLIFVLSDKIPLGRLPGDLQVGGERFKIYIPIATSILLSIVLTIVVNFFARK